MDDISHKTDISLDDFIGAFLPRLPEGIKIYDVLRRVQKTAAWKEFSSPANDPLMRVLLYASLLTPPLIHSQNISKLIYAMKHIMGVDVRRRFIFGITIENASMGLWYTNRAMLVGSKLLAQSLPVVRIRTG